MTDHLDSFPYRWRLCDVNYDPLPESALKAVYHVLDDELCREMWRRLAPPSGGHLMEPTDAKFADKSICKLIASELWHDDLTPHDLAGILAPHRSTTSRPDSPVLIFWNEEVAVFTLWHIFSKYWHNFFYPCDDSGVVCYLDRALNLYVVEDKLYLVDRDRLFMNDSEARTN